MGLVGWVAVGAAVAVLAVLANAGARKRARDKNHSGGDAGFVPGTGTTRDRNDDDASDGGSDGGGGDGGGD